MRMTLVSLVALVAGGALVGCNSSRIQADRAENFAQAGGLKLHVQLPRRYLQTGEDLQVAVTATNTTGKPIEIHSPTGAAVLVRITRYALLHAEQVRVYPGSATANILSWTLPAGVSRRFVLRIPVEPDWPVEEVLYLSAELNGYAEIAPAVAIIVKPPKRD